jgi:Transglycosylase SLT domain
VSLGTALAGINTYNPAAWGIGAVTGKTPRYAVKTVTPASLEGRLAIVTKAAEKYRINPLILWGVYGVETAHGSNVTTSSTGAKGSFQFEPETARAYGYPYTNATDTATFTRQAEGAAHYLSSLLPGGKGEQQLKGGKGGNWEAAWEKALHAYSGGGYGLAKVKQASSGAKDIQATTETNKAESTKVENEAGKGTGLFGPLIEFLGSWAVKGVLLLAGAVLMIYGVMVAVKPATREQHFPTFSRLPIPLPA